MRYLALILAAMVSLPVLADQERLSFKNIEDNAFQWLYCDPSGTDLPTTGEVCAANDHGAYIKRVDAATITTMVKTISGTFTVSVWGCLPGLNGISQSTSPATTTTENSAANQHCTKLSVGQTTNGTDIEIDGVDSATGIQSFVYSVPQGAFTYFGIVVDSCSSCDGIVKGRIR